MQRMEVASWEAIQKGGITNRICLQRQSMDRHRPFHECLSVRASAYYHSFSLGRRYTYEYLHKCIDEHKSKIEEQTRLLEKLSFEDSLTGLFNRNKFNLDTQSLEKNPPSQLGVATIDLNGLKQVNDRKGHRTGDDLICRTANHIACSFTEKCYRIGGDEFVVIDTELEEDAFRKAITAVKKNMNQDGISVSVGISWRESDCNFEEQFDEADKQMYQAKAAFYSSLDTDRRRNGRQ